MSKRRRSRGALVTLAAATLGAAAIAAVSADPAARSASFPPPSPGAARAEPPILGATIHFGMARAPAYASREGVRRQLDEAGLPSYRDGIVWSSFAFPAGAPPRLAERRRIVDFLPVGGNRPLMVLGAPSQRPAAMGAPFTDGQLRQFAAYVGATVEMTKTQDPIYEIWNEWNLKVGHNVQKTRLSGEGDPSDPRAAVHYVPVARLGTRAVKAANPEARVVVGAVADDPGWEWTKAIVRRGALEGADGLSVHLYNHCQRPERRSARELIDRTIQLQAALEPLNGGRPAPLYVTEYGWPTSQGKCGVSPEQAGANFGQFLLEAASLPWMRGLWMYGLKDNGVNPQDIESNFGLYTFDDRPKPAACFVREASSVVRGARQIEVKRLASDVVAMRAVMADHQILGVWNARPGGTARVTLEGTQGAKRRMCGDEPAEVAAGGLIEVGGAPLLARAPLDAALTVRVEN